MDATSGAQQPHSRRARNKMYPFTKKKDKMLIENVKKYPVLYDPTNPNFKNFISKHKIWEKISETMEVGVPDIKKRWKHFRDHYHKKLRMESAGIRTSSTWEYLEDMSFLSELQRERKDDSESEPEDIVVYLPQEQKPGLGILEGVERSYDDPDEDPDGDTEPKRKLRKTDAIAAIVESRLAQRFGAEQKSSIHKFFESMADIVVEFPPHLAAEARLKVCQLVNELESKKVKVEYDYM